MTLICYSDADYKYQARFIELDIPIDPRLETVRYNELRKVSNAFSAAMLEQDDKHHFLRRQVRKVKSYELFSNWLIVMLSDAKNTTGDPLIPLEPSCFYQLEINIANILTSKHTHEVATSKATEIVEMIMKKVSFDNYHAAVKKWIDEDHPDDKIEMNITNIIKFSMPGAKSTSITTQLAERLKLLWYSANSFVDVRNRKDLPKYIYSLILRHEALDPTSLRQGSLPESMILALQKAYSINFELFAGAVNTSSNAFCSLFPDLERSFGSRGNAFDLEPIRGFYQVNPPGIDVITDRALHHINKWLDSDEPLAFLLFTPPWIGKYNESYVVTFDGLEIFGDKLVYSFDPTGYSIQYVNHHTEELRAPYRAPMISVVTNMKDKWNFDELERIIREYLI